MTYFADAADLEAEITAWLGRCFGDEALAAAVAGAEPGGPTLLLRTVEPAVALTVDLANARVERATAEGAADVELELEADALHDILLNRLDAVQLSRLYETDRVAFAGAPEHLAGLIMLARHVQPRYEESLRERGRTDLLETPMPETKVAWGDPEEARSPRRMIANRRPWQRPKRAAPAA